MGGRTTPPFGHPSTGGEWTTPATGHPSIGGELGIFGCDGGEWGGFGYPSGGRELGGFGHFSCGRGGGISFPSCGGVAAEGGRGGFL